MKYEESRIKRNKTSEENKQIARKLSALTRFSILLDSELQSTPRAVSAVLFFVCRSGITTLAGMSVGTADKAADTKNARRRITTVRREVLRNKRSLAGRFFPVSHWPSVQPVTIIRRSIKLSRVLPANKYFKQVLIQRLEARHTVCPDMVEGLCLLHKG
jgi:hypothetical protein